MIHGDKSKMKLTIAKATEIATMVAKKSTEKHKIGSVIFDGNQYVAAFNRTFDGVIVTNRLTKYSDHAEAVVINHALHLGFDLTRSTLIVIRVNNAGNLMLAHPCKSCTKLIQKMGIPNVYYSSDPLHRELSQKNFKSLSTK